MIWYKHDTNARNDADIKKVRQKYGMTGYGLYWYCLELIATKFEPNKPSFELEHDAELIALDWRLDQHLVEEILDYFVEIKLFEREGSAITCRKMPEIRESI